MRCTALAKKKTIQFYNECESWIHIFEAQRLWSSTTTNYKLFKQYLNTEVFAYLNIIMSKMYDCLMIVMLSAQVRHNILHLWLVFLGFKLEMHVLRVILELPKINWHKAGVWISIGGIAEFIFRGSLISRGGYAPKGVWKTHGLKHCETCSCWLLLGLLWLVVQS